MLVSNNIAMVLPLLCIVMNHSIHAKFYLLFCVKPRLPFTDFPPRFFIFFIPGTTEVEVRPSSSNGIFMYKIIQYLSTKQPQQQPRLSNYNWYGIPPIYSIHQFLTLFWQCPVAAVMLCIKREDIAFRLHNF